MVAYKQYGVRRWKLREQSNLSWETVIDMTNILIIEDDREFAETLKEALEEDKDVKIVDIISDEAGAMGRIRGAGIDDISCFIVDLQLPAYPGDSSVNARAGLRIIDVLRNE